MVAATDSERKHSNSVVSGCGCAGCDILPTEVSAMGKGNNSQSREKKKPKKGAKTAPVKTPPAPKK